MYVNDGIAVMIVDDDADDVHLFREAIREINPHVNCQIFMGSEHFIQHLLEASSLPDYVFLDVNMPKINGLECLGLIRENQSIRNVPVVIYTTSVRSEDKEKAQRLGAFSYIVKPTGFNELKAYLRHILSGKKIWMY